MPFGLRCASWGPRCCDLAVVVVVAVVATANAVQVSILSQFNHPNITLYHECFVEENYLFIVMEYAEGGELYTRIQEQRKV